MGDHGCSELLVQDTASKLFQTAALLLGNEDDAVSLVEDTMAGVEVDPCADADRARVLMQDYLVRAAIRKLMERDPDSFAVMEGAGSSASCIEDDDLSAAGLSQAQLASLLEGEGRNQLRGWLDHLSAAQRAVFVERAMLGQDNAAIAQNLRAGGKSAAGWTPDTVSEVFRQALCSLATALVHAEVPAHAV
jgi:DNA-directed RNA polymerase specialized sigma24 family protein